MEEPRAADGTRRSASGRVLSGMARGAVGVGVDSGLVDRLLTGALTIVLVTGAATIGLVALVITALAAAVLNAAANPTGMAAAALGLAWFAGFLVIAGLGIRYFVHTIGRRVVAIGDRASAAAQAFGGVAAAEPAVDKAKALDGPTLAELDARLAPPRVASGHDADRS